MALFSRLRKWLRDLSHGKRTPYRKATPQWRKLIVEVLEDRLAPTADLTPFHPSGWSNKIVVSTQPGTNTDASSFTIGDMVYVDAAWANVGTTAAGLFDVLVDVQVTGHVVNGAPQSQSVTSPGLSTGSAQSVSDMVLGYGFLSTGTNTFTMRVDDQSAVTESNELNNTFSRSITVSLPANPIDLSIATGDILTTPAASWSEVSDSITVGGADVYRFTMTTTAGVFFDIDSRDLASPLSSTLDTKIALYNSLGVLLDTNDDGFDFRGFAAPASSQPDATSAGLRDSAFYAHLVPGTWYLAVAGVGGSTGAYKLRTLADTNTASASVPVLNSLPGAVDTLYLDFNGHAATDSWGTYSATAFDLGDNPETYSPAERLAIQNIWRVMAEDFSPFNINVSTVDPGTFADGVAQRIVFTQSDASIVGEGSSTLGVAYRPSYAAGGSNVKVAWTFIRNFPDYGAGGNGRMMAAALEEANTASHEFGHALGLTHYNSQSGGFAGNATIIPHAIMATPEIGLSRELWATGTNSDNVSQDDLALISSVTNTFRYRSDDHADSSGTATVLTPTANAYSASGIIHATSDQDLFRFTASGSTTITVDVDEYVNNLDVKAILYQSDGTTVIGTSDSSSSFDASFAPTLAAGTYYLAVTSNGDYGEVGQYALSITTTSTVVGTLAPTLSSGNLTIGDTDGIGKNNSLSVSLSGTNLVITDATEAFASAPAGGTLSADGRTLTIPLAAITGAITINGGAGNDTLTVDLTGGDPIPTGGLIFNGGNAGDDGLVITGGTTQGTVTYNATSPNSGSIAMSNFGTITYTGLEPIVNSGTAADVIFNLPTSGNVQAILEDDGTSGNGMSRLRSDPIAFEQVDFANPTGSLTINRGSATDDLTVRALPDFNARLAIGSAGNALDALTFAGTVTLSASKTLTADATTIVVNAPVSTSNAAMTLRAQNGITLHDALTTSGGSLTLNADSDANGIGTLTLAPTVLGTWSQQHKFSPAGGTASDHFGYRIALSGDGNTAIIGSLQGDVGTSMNQGYAIVLTRLGGVWSQQQQLVALDGAAQDSFGTSVALSADGNTAIVGAPNDDVGMNANQGSAYVFTRSDGIWTQQQLTAAAGTAGDFFGTAVALSDDGATVIIGATGADAGGANHGAATVFTRSGTVWTERQTLTASNGADSDFFGSGVALSSDGNTAIVGASGDDVGPNANQGSATVFTRSGSTWTEQRQLSAASGSAGDDFGYSVALSDDGNTAVVGAGVDDVGSNLDQGTAIVFVRTGSVWTQQAQLIGAETSANGSLGVSVAISGDGNTVLAGAYHDDVGALSDPGSATIFRRINGTWVQEQRLTDSDGAAFDLLGIGVGLSGDGTTAFAGAYFDDVGLNANQGSVVAFSGTPGTPGGSLATGTGGISITAADVDLQGPITSTSSVGITPSGTNRPIDLGTNTAGSLSLTDAEMDRVTTPMFRIGQNSSGALTVSNDISWTGGVLSLRSGSTVTASTGAQIDLGTNDLAIAAGGAITLNEGNTVGTLGATSNSGGIQYAETGDLTLGIVDFVGVVSFNGLISIRTLDGSMTVAATIDAFEVNANNSAVVLSVGQTGSTVRNLTIADTAAIRGTGGVTVYANDMNLWSTGSGTAIASTNFISLASWDAERSINLGTDAAGSVGLTDAELDRLSTGTLRIGNVDSGVITVSADITRPTSTAVELTTSSDIIFSGGQLNTGGGALQLQSGGAPESIQPTSTGTDATASTVTLTSPLGIDIAGTTADSQYTRLTVAGAVDLNGTALLLTGSYVPVVNNVFTIVSATSRTGTFDGLAEGSTLRFNNMTLVVNYTATSVTLTATSASAAADFRILSLGTTNSFIVDHNVITGDDRGGIAVSTASVFVTGDNATGRFNLANLQGGVSVGNLYDGLTTDLATQTAYVFGTNATTPLPYPGTPRTITHLLPLHASTGALLGSAIALSTPITVGVGAGVFAGYGRVVLHNGTNFYEIALPSGAVTLLGTRAAPPHVSAENWAYWGVAEHFGGHDYITYAQNSTTIARMRVADGAISPVATFSGLSDMASFTVSPLNNRWYFHYEGISSQFGGTQETVGYADATFLYTPLGSLSATLTGGNLTIADTDATGKNNAIAVSVDGTDLVITDASDAFSSATGGALSNGNRTLTIPLASVTGTLTFNLGGGNDTLTVNLAGGDPIPAGGLSYNGGAAGDDGLVITGGTQGTVTYNFTNANDGSIVMSNFGTIAYAGLEPITNSGTASDAIFNLPTSGSGNVQAILEDDGTSGNGLTRFWSSPAAFEQVDFANPTGSLTINRGSATDDLAINTLSDFNASLTIGSSSNPLETLTFAGGVTLAADQNLAAFASSTISLSTASSDLAASGTGSIALTSQRQIALGSGSSITTVDGALTLSANQQAIATTDFGVGILMQGATVQSTGTGAVSVLGKAGSSGIAKGIGLDLSTIRGGTSGTLIVTGIGGASSGNFNYGIEVSGSTITSAGANVQVTGTGGGSGAASHTNYGVDIGPGSQVSAGGSGTITVTGTGGTGTGATSTSTGNHGMRAAGNVANSGAASAGNVALLGTPGAGSFALGIHAPSGNISTTTAGAISLTADSMNLGGSVSINAQTRDVTLVQKTNSLAIHLGSTVDTTANTLELSDPELDRITAGTLRIGNGSTGAIIVNQAVTLTNAPTLRLTTGANVAQTASLSVANFGASANGEINLGFNTNDFDNVALLSTMNRILLGDSDGFSIDALAGLAGISAANTATLTAHGGNLTVNANVFGANGATLAANANSSLLTLAAGTTVSTTNSTVILAADRMNLLGQVNAGTGRAALRSNNSGEAIDLGSATDAAVDTLELSDAELDRISAGELSIGTSNSGAITFRSDIDLTDAPVISTLSLTTGSTISATAAGVRVANLALNANGAAGAVHFDASFTNVANLAASATSNIRFDDASALTITEVANTLGVASASGNVQLTVDAGNLDIVNTGAANDMSAGGTIALTLNGNEARFAVLSGAAISGPGTHQYVADKMDIQGTINAGTSATLRGRHAGEIIQLGSTSDGVAHTLELADPELDRVTTPLLQIGDSTSGTINVGAAITRNAATNMVLQSGNQVSLNPGSINTAGGTLRFTPGVGTFQPSSSGTDVTASTLSFTSGSDLALFILGTTPDSQYSRLAVAGGVDLTGVDLVLTVGSFTPGATDSFTIVDNDGADAIVGTFNGLAEGTLVNVNGVNKRITYVGGTGNDVVLQEIVPPTVVSVPALDAGVLPKGNNTITVTFSEPMLNHNVANNYVLTSVWDDGLLGSVDDAPYPVNVVSSTDTSVTLSFNAIHESVYRLRLEDTITDLAGNRLDGDGNGAAAGDWTRDFAVVPATNSAQFRLGGVYATGGGSTNGIVAADFNADGWDDIAAINSGNNTLALLLNTGADAFTTAVVPLAATPIAIVAADFNHDNHLDLALSNTNSTLSVFLGNGLGGFAAPATYSSGGASPSLFSTATGDFNEDTHLDLVVTNFGSNSVAVLVGNGTGAFAAPIAVTSAGQAGPTGVTVADVNHDNHQDLVVTYAASQSLAVFLGSGSATFAVASVLTGFDTGLPDQTAVLDWNSDSYPDLAVTTAGDPGIYLGNGLGQFTELTSALPGGYRVVATDLNRDGFADLIVTATTYFHPWISDGQGGTAEAGFFSPSGSTAINAVTAGNFFRTPGPDIALADNAGLVRIIQNAIFPGIATFGTPGGFALDVQTQSRGAGQLAHGTDNAFDGLNRLQIGGADFLGSTEYQLVDFNQTMLTPSNTMAGLTVTREVTVPSTGSQDFARTVDVFTNPTGSAITTTVTIVGNLGSDGATTVFKTSDGDTIVEATDLWIGTDDADGSGTPAIIHYIHGVAGLVPTDVQVENDNIYWTYSLTVPAGQTMRLAHFTILNTSRAGAENDAATLVTANGFGGQAAAFLTGSELASIANFVFGSLTAHLSGGDLVIADAAGKNNNLTIHKDDTNLVITDATEEFSTIPAGATLSPDRRTLAIPLSLVTGSITFNTADGLDTLTADFTGGGIGRVIHFNGGDPASGSGDQLVLEKGGSIGLFTSVTHTLTSASSGNATMGATTIHYTGLEPITDNLDVVDRVFNFNGGTETITLTDSTDVGGTHMTIDSDLGEVITFANPSGSLTINAGSGDDVVTISSVDAAYGASLSINGDAGSDTVNLNADITFAAGKNLDVNLTNDHTGGVVAPGDQVHIGAGANLLTSGLGAIDIRASRTITLATGSSLETTDGGIMLQANVGTSLAGDFDGIRLDNAVIQSSGGGSIRLEGFGGSDAATSSHDGINLQGGARIRTVGSSSGLIQLNGTAGAGTSGNIGVRIVDAGTAVSSVSGPITISGVGGVGSSTGNHGVQIAGGAALTATGAATISVSGSGGSGTNSNEGVDLGDAGTSISSVNGPIQLTGRAGAGISSSGLELRNSASVSATNADITLVADSIVIGINVNAGTNTVMLRQADAADLAGDDNGDAIDLGSLVKTTANTLALSDAELDRITAGTIQIGSASSGNITVSAPIHRATATHVNLTSGGTIHFTAGAIDTAGGDLTLTASNVIPASGAVDVAVNRLSFGSGTDLALAISGTDANTEYHQLNVFGEVDLTGADLILSNTYTAQLGDSFILVKNDGIDPLIGNFNGKPEGFVFTNFLGSGYNAALTYMGGDGNDVEIRLDASGPLVIGVTPSFTTTGTLAAGATSLAVSFNKQVLGAGTASNYELRHQGADGVLGNADDAIIILSASYANNAVATLTFAGLAQGVYRLTVRDTITDTASFNLDGDGNGVAGGDWQRDFVVTAVTGGFTFSVPQLLPNGRSNTSAVVTADFNGDGWDDIAAVDFSSVVSVYLNNGAGGFGTPINYSVPSVVYGVLATGDLNGDTQPDIAMSGSAGTVHLLYNTGSGTFATVQSVNISPLNSPYSLAIADMNNDSRGDIIVSDTTRVAVIRANGSGGFLAPTVTLPTGSALYPRPVTVADFNHDGFNDVFVPAHGNNTAHFFYGNGAGTLAPSVSYPTSGFAPISSATGDFNNDGYVDAVISHHYHSSAGYFIDAYLGSASGAMTRIASTLPLSSSYYLVGLAVDDLDNDGIQDLVLGTHYGPSILVARGLGNGSFVAGGSFLVGSTHRYYDAVATADFDRDGRIDIVVGNYLGAPGGVTVLTNQTSVGVALTSPNGFRFDIDHELFGAGQLIHDGGAFDGLNRLQVNGTDYSAPTAAPVYADGGQALMMPSQALAGLNVAREITVPSTGSQDFARTIDAFTNPTGSAITATVKIVGNLGSDADTVVFNTQDGDSTPEVTDQWIGTDDGDGTGTPAVIHYIHGPTGLVPTSVQVVGDNIVWTYSITVQPGATVQLAHYTILANTRAGAEAAASALVTNTGFTNQAAAFLNAAEIQALANFQFGTINATLNGGALTLTDDYNKTNNLSMRINGSDLVISDTTEQFINQPAGSSLSADRRTLTIPLALVTGDITINTTGGADTLTVNFSGGDFNRAIHYNGGDPATGPGDKLVLEQGAFSNVTHTLTSASTGDVAMGGTTVNYTGLEPVTDNLAAVSRFFHFNGGAETITLTDAAGAYMTLDSTAGEAITFANPSGSLTINAGTDSDVIMIASVDANFSASLTINGDADSDTIHLDADLTLAAGNSLLVTSDTINVGTGADLATSGAGVIGLTAENIDIAASSTLSAPTINVATHNAGAAIHLGGADAVNVLGLSDLELDRISAMTLNIGDAFTGNIDVIGAVDLTNGPSIATLNLATGAALLGSSGHVLSTNRLRIVAGTTIGAAGDALAINATLLSTSSPGNQFIAETDSVNVDDPDLDAGTSTITLMGGTFLTDFNRNMLSPVSVQSGATLGGAGFVSTVSVGSGGAINPGTALTGVLQANAATLVSGAQFAVRVDGNTPGLQHDQMAVSGPVDLGGATLVTTGSIANVPGQIVVLLGNGGTDAIVGTFNGLPEGAGVVINGLYFAISYVGDSGNDVTLLQGETLVSVVGNDLVISELVSHNATLTIQADTANSRYVIHDPNHALTLTVGTQVDLHTVHVPFSAFTGSILVSPATGNDSLTVDFALGNFNHALSYDGAGSDTLTLTGGGTFATVAHTLTNASTGTIAVTGNSLISYTGLEPITDNLSVANRSFQFDGGAEAITLTSAGATKMTIASPLSETITFVNPTTLLSINAGSGDDSVTITSVSSGFTAGLSVDGGAGADIANLPTSIAFGSGAHLAVASETVHISAGVHLTTSGTGTIDIAGDSIILPGTASLNAGSRTVTLRPNTAGTPIDLGGSTVGSLSLPDTLLDRVFAGTIVVGDSTSGALTISSGITRAAATSLTLRSGATISFATAGTLNTAGGHVTLSPATYTASAFVGNEVVLGSTGTLTFASGGAFRVQINGAIADREYERFKVVGRVDVTNADLELAGAFFPSFADVFTLIDNDGSDPVIGRFNGLPEGAVINFNGVDKQLTYFGGTGNDVVLRYYVPQKPTRITVAADGGAVGSRVATFTATVASIAPSAFTPTGTVDFYVDNVLLAARVPVNGAGQAILTTSVVSNGHHAVTAVYSGDGNFLASTGGDLFELIYGSRTPALLPGYNSGITPVPLLTFPQGTTWSISHYQTNLLIPFVVGDPAGNTIGLSAQVTPVSVTGVSPEVVVSIDRTNNLLLVQNLSGGQPFMAQMRITLTAQTTQATTQGTLTLHIGNAAPVLDSIADRDVVHTAGSTNVNFTASDADDALSPSNFSVNIKTLDQLAYSLDQTYNFVEPGDPSGNFFYNYYQMQEKYLVSGGSYYYVVPDGRFFQLGSNKHIGTLDASYYADPARLIDMPAPAAAPTLTTSITTLGGGSWNLALGNLAHYAGTLQVTLTAGDGVSSTSQAFRLGITDHSSASTALSSVAVASGTVVSGESTTVTLVARGTNGNQLTTGGLTVYFHLGSGAGTGLFGPVIDNQDGTYTATFTGALAGSQTITASIGNADLTSAPASIQVIPGALSLASSTVSIAETIQLNGTATVTLTANDANGNRLGIGGASVAFALGSGTATGTFGPVTDHLDGTYSATFTAGTAAGSNTVSATINGQPVTSAVPTFTLLNGPSGGIATSETPTFSWSAVAGAVSYDIWVIDLTTGQNPVLRNPVTFGTTWTPSAAQALTPGHAYQWYLGATNSLGATTYSGPMSFQVAALAAPTPTAPLSGTIAATAGYDRPTFTWTSVPGAHRYAIYLFDLSTNVLTVHDTNVSGTTYTPATALTPGRTYIWYVGAVSTNGQAISYNLTTPQTFTLSALDAPTPTAPLSGTIAPSEGFDRPTFTWHAVAGAAQYAIAVFDHTAGWIVFDTNVSGTSYTPATALTPGRTYTWYAGAVSTNGQAISYNLTTPQTFTLGALAAPTPIGPLGGTIPAGTGFEFPTFTWTSVPGADRYMIYLLDQTTGQLVTHTSVTGTAFTPATPLAPDHQYIWYIGAASANSAVVNYNLTTPQTFVLGRPTASLPYADALNPGAGGSLDSVWIERVGHFTGSSGALAGTAGLNLAVVNLATPQADVVVSAQVTLDPAGSPYAGLVARQSGAGLGNLYWAGLLRNGTSVDAAIYRAINGGLAELTRVPLGVLVGTQTLRFEVVNDSLKLFVNGTLAAYAFDSILTTGMVGLMTSQGHLLSSFSAVTHAPLTSVSIPPTFTESFAATSDAQLGTYWHERSGNFTVANNTAVSNGAVNWATLQGATITDATVQADVDLNAVGAPYAGVVARYGATGGGNMYWAGLIRSGASTFANIYRVVNGGFTQIATANLGTLAGTQTLRFELLNDSLKLFVNGALKTYAFDAVLSAAGSVGLHMSQGNTVSAFSAVQMNALTPVTLPFADAFNAADGQLGSSWRGRSGNFAIASNRAIGNGAVNWATLEGVTSSNVSVQADVAVSVGAYAGVVARHVAVGGGNMYWAGLINTGSTIDAAIFRVVNGVFVQLSRVSLGGTSSTRAIRFDVINNSLSLLVDNVLVASAADSVLTAAGSVGLYTSQGAAVDNFLVEETI